MISSSSFIRPLPRTTTYTSSCFACVWPYGKRYPGGMRWWLRPDCSSSSAEVARRNSRSGAPSKLEPTSSRSALRFLSVNGTLAILWSWLGAPIGACSSSAVVRGGGGELHRDAEAPSGAGRDREGSVVCLGDAPDDRQAEADARMVGDAAFAAALERLGDRGDQLRDELLAGVLDREQRLVGVNAGADPHAPLVGQVVDDRVVHEVRRHLQQERV